MPSPPDTQSLTPAEFWKQSSSTVVLDVRSPSEYSQGHIPGALNLPLFDDQQRAEIGTIHKNSGHEAAVLRGLKIIGPKMADLVVEARRLTDEKKSVLVYCWRGGQRSGSMGWLLNTAGMRPRILEGGYQAFRNFAQSFFDRPWSLQVISGLTGAGKTRILQLLHHANEQILDLEGLANHRGSAFGGIGQATQPTTESFENQLFVQLDSLDASRRIWIEDEGNRIGTVVVPHLFHQRLRHSPAIFIDSSVENRATLLIGDYGNLPSTELETSIQRIRKRLGGQHADESLAAMRSGNIQRAIEIVLAYYDKTYANAVKKMPRDAMQPLPIDELTDEEIVQQMVALATSNDKQVQDQASAIQK